MSNTVPLTVSGWQTVVVAVLVVLLALGYGELRAREAARRPTASPRRRRQRLTRQEADTVVRDR